MILFLIKRKTDICTYRKWPFLNFHPQAKIVNHYQNTLDKNALKDSHIMLNIISVYYLLMHLDRPLLKGFYYHFHNFFYMSHFDMQMESGVCFNKTPVPMGNINPLLKRLCSKDTLSDIWMSDEELFLVPPTFSQFTASSVIIFIVWNCTRQGFHHCDCRCLFQCM